MKITASIELRGATFSPKAATEYCHLALTNQQEPGSVSSRGRFAGQPAPFGSASVEVPETVPDEEKLMHAISSISGMADKLRSLGVTETYLYVGYFHHGQCNCVLSTAEITALHGLGIPMIFSTYDIGEEDPNQSDLTSDPSRTFGAH